MGFSIAILACSNGDGPNLLEGWGLDDTGHPDEENETLLSGVAADTHYLIWRNARMTKGFGDPDYNKMSENTSFSVLDINETVMVAMVRGFRNGHLLWTIIGSNDDGFIIEGDAPVDMEKVRENLAIDVKALNAHYDFEDDGDLEDDPFGLAVQAFVDMTGFRYDSVHELPFTELGGEMPGKKRAGSSDKPWWKFW